MKTMIMLDLGNGASREVDFISTMGVSKQVVIELTDDRPLSRIAAEFENVKTIRRTDNLREDVVTLYEGFTELVDIRRNQTTGSVRLTIKKP